jgi:hypothetical protein
VINRTLIFGSHFPFPGVGSIVENMGVFTWQPLVL